MKAATAPATLAHAMMEQVDRMGLILQRIDVVANLLQFVPEDSRSEIDLEAVGSVLEEATTAIDAIHEQMMGLVTDPGGAR